MKKKFILLLFVLLLTGGRDVCLGQTPVIYKNPTNSMGNRIRYDNLTGYHIMYSNPMGDNHFSITDISNTITDVKVSNGYTVEDFEIFEDYVVFCGNNSVGHGMIGWFHIDSLFNHSEPAHFDDNLHILGIVSLEDIEVYRDDKNKIHIAGYGVDNGSGGLVHKGFEAVGPTFYNMMYRVETFTDEICDLTVTDNYVAYLGPSTPGGYGSIGIFLYVCPRNDIFSNSNIPFFFYQTSSHLPGIPRITEPRYPSNIKIVHVNQDTVSVITCKEVTPSGSMYYPVISTSLVLRTYDLSALAGGSPVVMHSAYEMIYNINQTPAIHDFKYDPIQYTYSILQNSMNPGGYQVETVTQIDFHSGVPSAVPNYYWPYSNITMEGFCLSGSPYYTVSGFDPSAHTTYFWQDQYGSVPENCIDMGMLPFSITSVSGEKWELLPSQVTVWKPLVFSPDEVNPTEIENSYIMCNN